jgi:hypothetical protein
MNGSERNLEVMKVLRYKILTAMVNIAFGLWRYVVDVYRCLDLHVELQTECGGNLRTLGLLQYNVNWQDIV